MPRKKKAIKSETEGAPASEAPVKAEIKIEPEEKPAEIKVEAEIKPESPAPAKPRAEDVKAEAMQNANFNPVAEKCGDCPIVFKSIRCRSCIIYRYDYLPIEEKLKADRQRQQLKALAEKQVEAEKARLKNILNKD